MRHPHSLLSPTPPFPLISGLPLSAPRRPIQICFSFQPLAPSSLQDSFSSARHKNHLLRTTELTGNHVAKSPPSAWQCYFSLTRTRLNATPGLTIHDTTLSFKTTNESNSLFHNHIPDSSFLAEFKLVPRNRLHTHGTSRFRPSLTPLYQTLLAPEMSTLCFESGITSVLAPPSHLPLDPAPTPHRGQSY